MAFFVFFFVKEIEPYHLDGFGLLFDLLETPKVKGKLQLTRSRPGPSL